MNKGYTLLEILLVLTLILLLLGGVTVTYTRYNAQKSMEKDVLAFKDVVTLARERTIARDLGDTLNCTTFTGYRVQVDPAASTYRLYRMCQGLTIPPISTYQLQLTRIPGAALINIDFQYPYGTLSGAAQTIRFNNTRMSGCQQVLINAVGVISDQPC
ncbi:prepilin-type N-terminal cleavage/methylation domain-containing protein [Candidatus Woesebacteria bacterium]|nr:prepilin-type N-terminal cleavage/methylation domain-containing protein [Candidatus Woesebacteria bacterium]